MKRFALVALLAAMMFGIASSASATELKVSGMLDVYGLWSANLRDFDSDVSDGDNFGATQRMRTVFQFLANENLKAVLGLEINTDWGQGAGGDWGTDGTDATRVRWAYIDFNFPDTKINTKAGLQAISLPAVFGSPVFSDDAASVVVSAPISDMFGLTVGYTRGADRNDPNDVIINRKTGEFTDLPDQDDMDMVFLLAPVKLEGFAVTPYFAYAMVGENVNFTGQQGLDTGNLDYKNYLLDDSTIWVAGANAKLTVFDPLTFAADLIYGVGENDDYETKGWYAALAGSYKFSMLTATLFGTYGTGASDEDDEDNFLPTLAEDWSVGAYLGGKRAFSTGWSDTGFFTGTTETGSDGTGIWTVGLTLDKISFVDKLQHSLTFIYGQGTSDEDANVLFDENDSAWEVYMVNKYQIYEQLAAINELGFFAPDLEDADDADNSYFATIGFKYNF
ncbi:MAG: outer membrane homotrimeric porin [Desulfovibrionales bacterium]|nr:outer membrane homotrimeric porin [Desulfovibrionales bacterium]